MDQSSSKKTSSFIGKLLKVVSCFKLPEEDAPRHEQQQQPQQQQEAAVNELVNTSDTVSEEDAPHHEQQQQPQQQLVNELVKAKEREADCTDLGYDARIWARYWAERVRKQRPHKGRGLDSYVEEHSNSRDEDLILMWKNTPVAGHLI